MGEVMSLITLDLQVKIAEWRRKARDGTITHADLLEALQHLRQGRAMAGKSSTAKKATAASKKPDSDALLSELDGL